MGYFSIPRGIIVEICFKILIHDHRIAYIIIDNTCNVVPNAIANGIDSAFIGNSGIDNRIGIGYSLVVEIFIIEIQGYFRPGFIRHRGGICATDNEIAEEPAGIWSEYPVNNK